MQDSDKIKETACPHCGNVTDQIKAGMHRGKQRYKCPQCLRRYTPEPRKRGYSDELRQEALALYARGVKVRQIGLQLAINPRSILNWIPRQTEAAEFPAQNAIPADSKPADSPPPVKKRPTITDVAERAGVSRSTISHYLNGKRRMSEATHNRIRAAMDELNFSPSALMRGIHERRTRILGVYMDGLTELNENVGGALAPPMLAGINAAAYDAEQNILLFTGLRHHSRYPIGFEFLNGHIDGLLWVIPQMHEPALERVAAAGLPTIAVLTRHVPESVGFINADNAGGVRAAVMHLAGLGHRRIAFAGPAYQSNFSDRIEGYRQGLALAKIPWTAELESSGPNLYVEQDYLKALNHWLELPEPPTAITLPSDGWAFWMIKELRRRGLRVPEDVAVTGFDDVPDARTVQGGITTVRQSFRNMGAFAVERLIAMIEGASVEECRVTVPVELIVRASTVSNHEP